MSIFPHAQAPVDRRTGSLRLALIQLPSARGRHRPNGRFAGDSKRVIIRQAVNAWRQGQSGRCPKFDLTPAERRPNAGPAC